MNNNNLIYSTNHFKIFDKLVLKKRLEIVKVINDLIKMNNISNVLDIGTTSDNNESSNIIVKSLHNIKDFNSISDQKITSTFFKKILQKSITEEFTEDEVENFKSDLVISNATIEHVGNYENQKKMMQNIIRLTSKVLIVATPNRYHPFDFHTKLPLIHWLPKNIHRKILKLIGLSFYSEEKNLNLLSKNDFIKLIEDQEIQYRFEFTKFFFFNSNIIFIGFKK